MLACGLVERGHEVSLFAHADSRSKGDLVPWPGLVSTSRIDILKNTAVLTRQLMRSPYDLVHSFSRLAYLAPILPAPVPKLMTYQRAISPRTTGLANRLARGTLQFSAISRWMVRSEKLRGRWHIVPNGVSLERYDFRADPGEDAPLVFLGRIEEIKGPHLAIEVAQRASVPLVIAGNVPPDHEAFFRSAVLPHVDGKTIRYFGPVDDARKNDLLGNARGLLMPILWEEPFGIVMTEAMACGTPVIGFSRGAVPEVVEHDITGYVGECVGDLVAGVRTIAEIDRHACRRRVERLYSGSAIVDAYLDVYAAMMGVRSEHDRT